MKNKIIAAILTLTLVCSSAAILSFATYMGDVNGDGKVTASDARAVLRFAASIDTPTDEQRPLADTNGDNKITAADARQILRWASKLEDAPEYTGGTTAADPENTTEDKKDEQPSTTEPSVTDSETTTEAADKETTTGSAEEPTTGAADKETTTKPADTETDEPKPGDVVAEYPAAIDAFLQGKFYMEMKTTDDNGNPMTVKFATKNNVFESSLPVDGIELSVLIMGNATYLKLVDSNNKKYYADFTELGFNISDALDGMSFSVTTDYDNPVYGKTTVDGIEYDTYTFSLETGDVAFFVLNGEVTAIQAADGSTMVVEQLSNKIPSNMLNLRGYDRDGFWEAILTIFSENEDLFNSF